MTGLDPEAETLAVVRHNRAAIDEIIESVAEGTYCAVLGPRLSGKTELLRYVEQTVAAPLGWTCVYLDLYAMRASTLQGFFADLMRLITGGLQDLTGVELAVPDKSLASSAVFRAFLADVAGELGRDLVLIIEHLEAVPTDLVQALLTSLRAAFMDQQTQEQRVMVVVSGALSLATLTVGESSPFRGIARRVFIGDLSREQSAALIAESMAAEGVRISRRARQRLLRAASGDPYLIRQLCQRGAERVRAASADRLRAGDAKQITRQFVRDDVYRYAPLQEAVRLIEEDPDLLHCVLLLLAYGPVPRAELPLPLSPDVDPLYLTGVVERIAGDRYRLQNDIYREFLTRHFHPGRVGHLLTMAGRWDSALDYLEVAIQEGNEQARFDLLPATINSIYAADDMAHGAHFLARGLSAAFGVVDARVWYAPPQEDRLRLVGHLGPRVDSTLWSSPELPLSADRLEARAFRQRRPLRGQEAGRHVWRAYPLLLPGQKPIGVVTLCDDLQGGQHLLLRERDLQIAGYLSQAARALQAVGTRRQELALAGRVQASLLPAQAPEVPGWQLAATLRPARETSGDFYDFIPLPGGRLGILIADVADKGLAAALYMALSRTVIRTYAASYSDRPDLALHQANIRILGDTQAGMFVTVFYGILDPAAGTLTYCNAGHHPPYFMVSQYGDAAGEAIVALPGRGLALGIMEGAGWGHSTLDFPPGAVLLLYTDGVVDACNSQGERFGNAGLLAALRAGMGIPAQEALAGLVARVQTFVGEQPQFDDLTLVAISRDQTSGVSEAFAC